MPRKAQTKHGPEGRYYRKRLPKPGGGWIDVYGKTLTELAEKVTLKQNELAAADAAPKDQLYVFEYAAGFYARRAPHLSAERRKVYQYQINKVICPVIGGKLIREITRDDLEDVLATRAHLSHRSQKETVQILKQIFEAAEDAGAVPRDPSRKLEAHGDPPPKKNALTELQEEQLLAAVRGLKIEPFVMLGLFTGMRRGEICGLRWDCVDLNEKAPCIHVRRACRWPDKIRPVVSDKLKSPAAYRSIPIPKQLQSYLQAMRDEQEGTDQEARSSNLRTPTSENVEAARLSAFLTFTTEFPTRKSYPLNYPLAQKQRPCPNRDTAVSYTKSGSWSGGWSSPPCAASKVSLYCFSIFLSHFGSGAPSLPAFSRMLPSSVMMYHRSTIGVTSVAKSNGSCTGAVLRMTPSAISHSAATSTAKISPSLCQRPSRAISLDHSPLRLAAAVPEI